MSLDDERAAGPEDFLSTVPHRWSRNMYGDRMFFFDAFLSHAGGDHSAVFAEELRSRGVKLWHDETQVMKDALWSMRLQNALLRSRYLLLVVDDEHDLTTRNWVKCEWQSALHAEPFQG